MVTRRTFLVTGIAGSAALALAFWGARARRSPAHQPRLAPGTAAHAMLAAIADSLLAGALPLPPGERRDALAATVRTVADAIAGLPEHARHELDQLFALLTFAPTRLVVARLPQRWEGADAASVDAFLLRLQHSDTTLLRSAYDALHQLVLGAWYGQAQSWSRIGYPGPPRLS